MPSPAGRSSACGLCADVRGVGLARNSPVSGRGACPTKSDRRSACSPKPPSKPNPFHRLLSRNVGSFRTGNEGRKAGISGHASLLVAARTAGRCATSGGTVDAGIYPASSSARTSYRSLRRKRQSSFISSCFLSKSNPLRWASIWLSVSPLS